MLEVRSARREVREDGDPISAHTSHGPWTDTTAPYSCVNRVKQNDDMSMLSPCANGFVRGRLKSVGCKNVWTNRQ